MKQLLHYHVILITALSLTGQLAYAQITVETESSQSGWVTSGLGPYPSSSWTNTTDGTPSATGRTPGTTSGRLLWITAANAGVSAGTYNIDARWYDDNTETSSMIYLQIGSRTCEGSNFSVCHTGTLGVDDQWNADLGSPGFSIKSYTNVTVASNDTIFYYLDLAGNSTNTWIDYIEFTSALPNVNPPQINNQAFSVDENSANGTIVGTVAASDADPGQSVTSYSITAGNTGSVFAIDNNGQITVNGALDFETTSSYPLTVEACDNGTPVFCSSATVTITITDIFEAPNNNDPVITNPGVARSVQEMSPGGTAAGSALTAMDADGNSVTFSITGGNTGNAFYINSTTGQIYVNSLLDFETLSSYTLQITATDNGTPGRNSTSNVVINVTDIVENSPSLNAWYGTCSGTTVPIVANVVGATFTGWQISGGGITDITSPSSASTTVTNHASTVTYTASAVVPTGPNLITNGDFEAGSAGCAPCTGFTSSYSYDSSPDGPGDYVVTQNGGSSSGYLFNMPDHTSGSGWYLAADGSGNSGEVVYQSTVSVTNGLSYAFSGWFANGHEDGAADIGEAAHLEFRVNGVYSGDIQLPADGGGIWYSYSGAYTAVSTGSITIEIVNRNTEGTKNDFYIDDLEFQQGTLLTDNITVPSCSPPLPVSLISFKGWNEGNKNMLTWVTASEENNNYFIVEKSFHGIDFIPIGVVQGNGNSSADLNYLFDDITPHDGANYYRLKQVDHDGSFSFSNTIAIDNRQEIAFEIYPNPSNGTFIIGLSASDHSYRLEIIDTEGRTVYSASGEVIPEKVAVTNLASGFYIVRLYLENKIIVQKLVVY